MRSDGTQTWEAKSSYGTKSTPTATRAVPTGFGHTHKRDSRQIRYQAGRERRGEARAWLPAFVLIGGCRYSGEIRAPATRIRIHGYEDKGGDEIGLTHRRGDEYAGFDARESERGFGGDSWKVRPERRRRILKDETSRCAERRAHFAWILDIQTESYIDPRRGGGSRRGFLQHEECRTAVREGAAL